MQEKIKNLGLAEQLIAGGGILMFIASFLDWWHFSAGVETISISGGYGAWGLPGSIWSTLAVLVSIVLAGIVIATKLGNVQMPALPQNVTWGQVWGGGAAAVVVFVILKAWRIQAAPVGSFGIGFWIGLVATVAIAYGGYLLYTKEKAAG